jgi:hypothetical protein
MAPDAGAFAALGGQDVGVAGVGVAPAQVVLKAEGQHGVVGMIRAAHGEGPQGTELRFDRVGPRGVCRVKHSSTLARLAQARITGVLFADRLSAMT